MRKLLTKNKCLVILYLQKRNNVRKNGGVYMKIVNRKKFIRMITIILGILLVMFFYFSNSSFSKEEVKTKTIYVSNGDTLWTIAEEEQETNPYYQEKDIRTIIHEIKKLNYLPNNSNLTVGQKLILNNE